MSAQLQLLAALQSIEDAKREIEEAFAQLGESAMDTKSVVEAAEDADGDADEDADEIADAVDDDQDFAFDPLRDRDIETVFGYTSNNSDVLRAIENIGSISKFKSKVLAERFATTVFWVLPSCFKLLFRGSSSNPAERLQQLHHWLEILTGILILANVFTLGAEAQVKAMSAPACPDPWLIVSMTFDFIFVLEILLRFHVNRQIFTKGREKNWNRFDAVVVAISALEDIAAAVVSHMGCRKKCELSSVILNILRALKIFRLIRFLKAVHVLPMLRHLRLLSTGIARCVRPFAWALVMMFFLTWSFSIILLGTSNSQWQRKRIEISEEAFLRNRTDAKIGSSAHFEFANTYENFEEDVNRTEYEKEIIKHIFWYYSSMPGTMLMLLMCVTGGIDWNDGLQPLLFLECWASAAFLMLYVIFVVLALFNLITGLFVDRVVKEAEHDAERVIEDMLRHKKEIGGQALSVFNEAADSEFVIDMTWVTEKNLEQELRERIEIGKDAFIEEYEVFNKYEVKMEANELGFEDPLDVNDVVLPLTCRRKKKKELAQAEFENHLLDENVQGFLSSLGMDPINARRLFNVLDYDDNGRISQDEFVTGCMIFRGPAKATDLAVLCKEFHRFQQTQKLHMQKTSQEIHKLSSALGLIIPSRSRKSIRHSVTQGAPQASQMQVAPQDDILHVRL